MSAEEVRKLREEKLKKRGGGKNWLKLPKKTGTIYIRIGPPWKKDGEFWKERLVHGSYKNKVYCAKNDYDEERDKPRRCAVCRRLKELKAEKGERAKKLFGLINQRAEGLWNVLEGETKKVEGKTRVSGPVEPKFKIMQLAQKWHLGLLDIFGEEDYRERSELGVTSPKFGRWIQMKRVGEGMDTEWTFRVLDKETPISKDKGERKEILATLINLDDIVKGSSDEELEAFVRQMEKKAKRAVEENGEEEEEEEDRPKKKARDEDEDEEEEERPKKKKKKSEDEEEEDGEESEEEDEDENETAEKVYKDMKKSLSKKAKKKHKEEEEDEDEAEEESEEEDDDEDEDEEEDDEEE